MSDFLYENALAYESEFPDRWAQMMDAFHSDGEDAFWMIRHASYLFRTGGIRWGMDLSLGSGQMEEVVSERVKEDLSGLAFILVSHFHGDHFTKSFFELCVDAGAPWLVPDFVDGEKRELLAAHENVRFVKAGDVIALAGARIRVLPGHHYDDGGRKGVPCYAYEVTAGGRTFYFPGDVRDYRACARPECRDSDVLFAHVWLGRSRALLRENDVFLDPYCEYLASHRAKRVYLTHLYDMTRAPEEMWLSEHAQQVREKLLSICPQTEVSIPAIGQTQLL